MLTCKYWALYSSINACNKQASTSVIFTKARKHYIRYLNLYTGCIVTCLRWINSGYIFKNLPLYEISNKIWWLPYHLPSSLIWTNENAHSTNSSESQVSLWGKWAVWGQSANQHPHKVLHPQFFIHFGYLNDLILWHLYEYADWLTHHIRSWRHPKHMKWTISLV